LGASILVSSQQIQRIISELQSALCSKSGREDILAGIEPFLGLEEFDWPSWQGRRILTNSIAISSATQEDCYKLLVTIIRGERFSEGTIENAFDNGIIEAITHRLKNIS
jgi:hypothetical protein